MEIYSVGFGCIVTGSNLSDGTQHFLCFFQIKSPFPPKQHFFRYLQIVLVVLYSPVCSILSDVTNTAHPEVPGGTSRGQRWTDFHTILCVCVTLLGEAAHLSLG